MGSYTRDEAAAFLTANKGHSLYADSHGLECWYSEGSFVSRDIRGHLKEGPLPNTKFRSDKLDTPEQSFVERYAQNQTKDSASGIDSQWGNRAKKEAQLIEEMVAERLKPLEQSLSLVKSVLIKNGLTLKN